MGIVIVTVDNSVRRPAGTYEIDFTIKSNKTNSNILKRKLSIVIVANLLEFSTDGGKT
jgi:hypothetical protein